MGFPIHNIIFDVADPADQLELASVALIVLDKKQTRIFNALYSYDGEYAARHSITHADIREPLRGVYLQSFDFVLSERALDYACDVHYQWWQSIRTPNAFRKVTLADITSLHEIIGNEGQLKNNPNKAEYLQLYNSKSFEAMYC